MTEQVFPFTAEFSENMVTILSEEDIIGTSFWHNQTIMQRYYAQTGKQPKLSKKEL